MPKTPLHNILSVTAHPDDAEMHHAGLLSQANSARVMIATRGEATTLNFTNTPPELLVQQRHEESKRALAFYGFRGIWLDLPDGQLIQPENVDRLSEEIVQTSLEQDITALVSMGSDGYCDHPDHIAAHLATVSAQDALARDYGQVVPVYELDTREGQIDIPVDREKKMAGFALHASQFMAPNGQLDREFWQKHRAETYEQLLRQETYKLTWPTTSPDFSLAGTQTQPQR